MDKHRQMAVKVIYLAIALLKGDLGVDVRDSCREDRQLYLWHAEIVATFGQKSSLLSLFNRSKTVSSHFLFLPIFHPEGSGVLRLVKDTIEFAAYTIRRFASARRFGFMQSRLRLDPIQV